MTCPDCCTFHESLRWVWQAFASGHFYLGLVGGILLTVVVALIWDY